MGRVKAISLVFMARTAEINDTKYKNIELKVKSLELRVLASEFRILHFTYKTSDRRQNIAASDVNLWTMYVTA